MTLIFVICFDLEFELDMSSYDLDGRYGGYMVVVSMVYLELKLNMSFVGGVEAMWPL